MEKRKLKQSLLWVTITAVVLVAVILFNILFTALAHKYLWVVDTMPNDLVVISDYSRELLEKVDSKQNDITIYFLADPDELENYELLGHQKGESNSTWGMSYIYNLAKYYEKEFPFIKVDTLDTSADADYIRENFAMTVGTSLTPLTVVMENRVDGRMSYRTMQRDEFFSITETTMYFRGDDKFTSTLLSLTGEKSVAYFIEGHGEKIGEAGKDDSAADFGNASALVKLFEQAGYLVQKINLAEEDFPEQSEDIVASGAATVVLFGPESDFKTDVNGVNEITRLRKYLNKKNHNLMVFMDPETEEMPVLDEYLYDYWGVEFEDNVIVADTTDPLKSPALSEDGSSFLADYELDTVSPGSALTASLTVLDTLPGAYFGATRTISMKTAWSNNNEATLDQELSTSFKLGATFLAPKKSAAIFENNGGYRVFDKTLYESYVEQYDKAKRDEITALYNEERYQFYYEAYAESSREEFEKDGLTAEEIAEKCAEYAKTRVTEDVESYMRSYIEYAESDASALMTLTHGAWSYAMSESVNLYLLACGSTAFASEEAINNAAYSNRDTLYSAIYLFGKNVLPYDIDIIKIETPSSLAIDDSAANGWTIFLSGILPLVFVATGAVVVIRRRKHN